MQLPRLLTCKQLDVLRLQLEESQLLLLLFALPVAAHAG
jgi:hypothetical protein